MKAAGVAGGPMIWARRLSIAAILTGVAIAPGPASGPPPAACSRPHCEAAGIVLWTRALPGQWVVRNGLNGTTPAQGQAYAALGGQVAAVGTGMTVHAYGTDTGKPLWTTTLSGFPAGSSIVSVRVWPGAVTVGVTIPLQSGTPSPAGAASGAHAAAPVGTSSSASAPHREEVVLSAAAGHQLRAFPAAPFGGAVAADASRTVVVGVRAVTCYSNRTGRTVWSRPTGQVPQAWQVDTGDIYVTVSAGGYLGTAPVTALRRINLRSGDQRLVRARNHAFAGRLSLVFRGVVVFTSARGVTAYNGTTGERLWRRAGALPESVDVISPRLYLLNGNVLVGVDPRTGAVMDHVYGAAAIASSGLYGVREGAVFGLDHGALGKAWGYDAGARRVIWTSVPLPWPHYFVDLSGIGGSASPSQDAVVLAVCAQVGPQSGNGGTAPCLRPELVALSR